MSKTTEIKSETKREPKPMGLVEDRSAHGLRKSAPIRLANAGCTAHEIAAVTGHRSLREVEHYTRAADQERLARQAMGRMKVERGLSNLPTRLDKKTKKH
jgi:integrase